MLFLVYKLYRTNFNKIKIEGYIKYFKKLLFINKENSALTTYTFILVSSSFSILKLI